MPSKKKSPRRSPRRSPLTAYQKFVKKHMHDEAIKQLPQHKRFTAVAKMWKQSGGSSIQYPRTQ